CGKIEQAVPVQVEAGEQRGRSVSEVLVGGMPENASAEVPKHGNATPGGHGEIGLSVSVEVGDRQGSRVVPASLELVCPRGLEGPTPAVEKNEDTAPRTGDQVRLAVSVEVRGDQRPRKCLQPVLERGLEASPALVVSDGDPARARVAGRPGEVGLSI